MGYVLGVDLGTTWTAAAVVRDGGPPEVATLGTRAAAIPSVLFLREDGELLVGEAAQRRGPTDRLRFATEFKRRVGDPTPILLAGSPFSAERLMAELLRHVVDLVAAREGARPLAVAVTHPANWGPYKLDLLQQATRLAGLIDVVHLTEPEGAATEYGVAARLAPGDTVGVYDLGGGTFDATVVRRTDEGFELLGRPEGIERLGGIDIDEAVFGHVVAALGDRLAGLDRSDPAVVAGMVRLRQECIAAKEALSADTDVSIPVALPGVQTEVRLTRTELEDLVRPALEPTTGALRRALDSAGVEPTALRSVLLVGGSAQIPLVGQLVATDIGVAVARDVHPKHAVATGAARHAWATREAAGAAGPGPGPGGAPADAGSAPLDALDVASAVPAAAPVAATPTPAASTGAPAATGATLRSAAGAPRSPRVPLIAGGVALGVAGVVAVAALAGGGGGGGSSGDAVIVLQPASTVGPDPFTSAASGGSPFPGGEGGAPPPTAPDAAVQLRAVRGSEAELYTAFSGRSPCDVDRLARELAADSVRLAAWAPAAGISASELGTFLGSLTGVYLNRDVRVTSNGFRGGAAAPRQAILQRGTAVLVDNRGVPRVHCGGGNPLASPVASASRPSYTGSSWSGFDLTAVVIVRASDSPIERFVLRDVTSGTRVLRTPGTRGEADQPG